MIFSIPDVKEKRKKFKEDLEKKSILRFIGSFSPLVSRLIEEKGFEGIYISGAVISSDLALPDVELITLSELSYRGAQCVQNSGLPALVDVDTGFGSLLNVARTTKNLERAGFCGLHIEDQQSPKRCGHLDNKKLLNIKEMQEKLNISLKAKTDPNFLICARTDARGAEGFDRAIERATAYVSAGAEAIFPEALQTREEFVKFRDRISVPLIANMTEFGKSELLSAEELERIGYNIVLYPVTAWRWALKAVERGLSVLMDKTVSQKDTIKDMLTREELYKLLQYKEYEKWDSQVK